MQNFLNQWQINEIFNLALESGEIAKVAFLTNSFKIYTKEDKSKVSSTDLEISQLIAQNLAKICPNIPIVCEEGSNRQFNDKIFFLIDPIDGTSSFINNSDEFCINIALIQNNKPVFGLIYAPIYQGGIAVFNNHLNEVIFYSHQSHQFKKINYQKSSNNHLKIVTSTRTKNEDVNIFVKQYYPNFLNNYSLIKLSSAIKFITIIDNTAQIYLHFRKSMEWDIAAGHALINLINLHLINLNYENNYFSLGDELQYKKNNFINNRFIINALN